LGNDEITEGRKLREYLLLKQRLLVKLLRGWPSPMEIVTLSDELRKVTKQIAGHQIKKEATN
jgi:hypothetical protein